MFTSRFGRCKRKSGAVCRHKKGRRLHAAILHSCRYFSGSDLTHLPDVRGMHLLQIAYCMSRKSVQRFCKSDVHKNKDLKARRLIRSSAMRSRPGASGRSSGRWRWCN
ncbi:hypothetical protein EJ074_23010 [Mesorhizobium sp. M3A.F.Ca.ET.080.04.2.1]|nr:hypothetical protein EJ074_23010 [Mesorhizobium sp. M3A.F.Ca.ET.080.04.2.1]RWB87012.1 MAG: hypothetical protein EOQ52_17215 [Mesorhizobium sp.]RWE29430.1 MAG: hypothetical protein EOS77_22985 [Mesorhizobium sp.]TGS85318.1 hypothetical protein EN818_20440 [Mesorhizobium sp. M3A.F.Ca.ET.175.01.1.1]TGT56590.1 hypothetical protein EN813_042285 [Mesorhizobium sp. M00.F.Ca.ET.170.01.1.1]